MGWPGPMTHRQFRAWENWMREEMDLPSRTDHYLMQIAYILSAVHSKKGKSPKMENFRLKFKVRGQRNRYEEQMDRATLIKRAREQALSRMTKPVIHIKAPPGFSFPPGTTQEQADRIIAASRGET